MPAPPTLSPEKSKELEEDEVTGSEHEGLTTALNPVIKPAIAATDDHLSFKDDLISEADQSFKTQDTVPISPPATFVKRLPADSVIQGSTEDDLDTPPTALSAEDINISRTARRLSKVAEITSNEVTSEVNDSSDAPASALIDSSGTSKSRLNVDGAMYTATDEDITPAHKELRQAAPRGIKRTSRTRADLYDVPDDEPDVGQSEPAKKRKSLSKAARDSHNQDDGIAVATSSVNLTRKLKSVKKAAWSSKEGDEEITTAESTVKRKKSPHNMTQTPAKGAQSATPSSSALIGKSPKVLLSASNLKPAAKGWMKRNKINLVDDTPSKRTDFVCVVRDESLPCLVKVPKTLVAGKLVVSDSWITDSQREGELQGFEDYVHADLKALVRAAKTWNMNWPEIQQLATDAGATGAIEVLCGNAAKGHAMKPKDDVVLFGVDDDADVDAQALIKTHGRIMYSKTVLAQWIIHAEVDLENAAFQLTLPLGGKGIGLKEKGKKR